MSAIKNNDSNRVMIAVVLITLGAMAVMGLGLLWPVVFIMLPGLVMLWIAVVGGKLGTVSMAVPGALMTGTGALMFVQNITGHWESWAYAWTLYGAFLGLAFALMGQRLEEPAFTTLGRWFVYVSLGAFAAFGVLFELLIFNSMGPILPVLLIAAGLYLLSRDGYGTRLVAAFGGEPVKTKRSEKAKRLDEKLFTGPIVYGSTVRASNGARIAVMDMDDRSEPVE